MSNLTPYIILGLAFGGVYSLSGVGTVLLFRATGVLNFASGAVGALGALVAWELIVQNGLPDWLGFAAAIAIAVVISVAYGAFLGPRFADSDALTKAIGTLGLLLVLLGVTSLVWGNTARYLTLPTSNWGFDLGDARVSGTQVVAVVLALAVTAATTVFLRASRLGTAMRAMADNRDVTAMLGVPIRRVELTAWLASGTLSGLTGILLTGLVGLDTSTLAFLIIPTMAAAVIGRLQSLWGTFAAGFVIGVVQSSLALSGTFSEYRNMTPFVLAIVVMLWLAWRHPTATRV